MARVRDLTPDQNERLRAIVQNVVLTEHGGNRTEFARRLDVSQPAVSQFLNGSQGMSRANAEKIAELLGRPLNDLIGPPGGQKPVPRQLDPVADARNWFLHRIEHDTPERLDAAREWLDSAAPPYTGRPVPWNNTLVDRFNFWWSTRVTTPMPTVGALQSFVRYPNLAKVVADPANKNRWPDDLVLSIANKALDDRQEDLTQKQWAAQLDAIVKATVKGKKKGK